MMTVFVDTSVLIASEDVAAGELYKATLAWLDVLWRTRSGRTGRSQAAQTAEIDPLSGLAARIASILARLSAMPPSETSGVTRSSTLMSGLLPKTASAITPRTWTGGKASNTNITTLPFRRGPALAVPGRGARSKVPGTTVALAGVLRA